MMNICECDFELISTEPTGLVGESNITIHKCKKCGMETKEYTCITKSGFQFLEIETSEYLKKASYNILRGGKHHSKTHKRKKMINMPISKERKYEIEEKLKTIIEGKDWRDWEIKQFIDYLDNIIDTSVEAELTWECPVCGIEYDSCPSCDEDDDEDENDDEMEGKE